MQRCMRREPGLPDPSSQTELFPFSEDSATGRRGKDGTTMTTWVFPGQGSQAKGMGDGLFDRFPELVAKADALLGYSVAELCREDPGGRLSRTEYTQPALYVVNALSCCQKLAETGRRPDFVAGHSLGEYNALLAG